MSMDSKLEFKSKPANRSRRNSEQARNTRRAEIKEERDARRANVLRATRGRANGKLRKT